MSTDAWPELPRYRCGEAGCPANCRHGVGVPGASGRDDLAAAERAYDRHYRRHHPDLAEEEVDRAAELLVA